MNTTSSPPSGATISTTGPGTATPAAPTSIATAIEAAQAALAAEHACVYGYGIVGAQLRDTPAHAHAALTEHRNRRDALAALIREAQAEPVAARAAYRLDTAVVDEASAAGLAAMMERRLGELYVDLVAAADSARWRRFAARALSDVTAQAVSWGAALSAFPGLDGRRRVTSPDSGSPDAGRASPTG